MRRLQKTPEFYLFGYIIVVLVFFFATLRHYGLWTKTPVDELEDKKTIAQRVMGVLHQIPCPLCGGNTYVESVDLFKTNTAIMVCENAKCLKKSLWKFEKNAWRLISPYTFSLLPPIVSVEAPKEEIALVFG